MNNPGYRVQLQLWSFCVSGALLGIAAVSVKYRISLAIATTVILSIVAPGSMTDARITAPYTAAFANGFLAILVPVFHRPFDECKSCSSG